MATLVAAESIMRPLSVRIPRATRISVAPGDRVRAYRDRQQVWDGPFLVQRIMGERAWLLDNSGRTKQFNIVQLLHEPSKADDSGLRNENEFLRRHDPE